MNDSGVASHIDYDKHIHLLKTLIVQNTREGYSWTNPIAEFFTRVIGPQFYSLECGRDTMEKVSVEKKRASPTKSSYSPAEIMQCVLQQSHAERKNI